MFGWGENKNGKKGEENMMKNDIFSYSVQERNKRQKMGRKIISSGPHFFVLPIWRKTKEKRW